MSSSPPAYSQHPPAASDASQPHRQASDASARSSTAGSPTSWNPDPSGLKRSGTTLSKKQVKRATRTRKVFGLLTSFFFLLSFIFLMLVEVGTIYDKPVLRDTFFIKLDLSHIVPTSIPNAVLLNSIAETLGLHDFYQVGLWGFCEGYDSGGITECSKPKQLYWFNPVEILLNELLSGATIAIPAEALQYLDMVKTVSHWMFGLFLTGCVLSVIMIFLAPLSVFTRWASLPIALLSFATALFITVAAILATAMFIIFKVALTKVDSLNIGATIGNQMFAFMWIAAACSILAWLIQAGLCCFCASRRDVRLGKKLGSKKAYSMSPEPDEEKASSGRRFPFGRK
ncbi:SUR7/PalI family-domain-containing protein [Phyllosticta citricarpa]|uniref:SUR7/PalI family-domain-containing protein n=2 Tax=Phyllosticta TaxID=121621 RepID=A0ABR1MM70_9PEZI